MEGPISDHVKERLPSALKSLDETYQKAFIYLRLRKTENEISRLLHLSSSEIITFSQSINIPLIPGKNLEETKE